MRQILAVLSSLLLALASSAQSIRTIVPQQPIAPGTAFQVQFIITEPEKITEYLTPDFEGFRLVSGPFEKNGELLINNQPQPVKNIYYTLEPIDKGKVRLEGLKAVAGNRIIGSPDVFVKVTARNDAGFVSSSLGEQEALIPSPANLDKYFKENLFIKTEVSRKTCYAGEPVLVSFTLYSRLQSTSEPERSPAFYGFSVLDLVDYSRPHYAVKEHQGKMYNTSILRKVLLYPVQAGDYEIDPVFVHNIIELTDPLTGVTKEYETRIQSERIMVQVKPLPAQKPADFSGAVGEFKMDIQLEKPVIQQAGQGKLLVALTGKGNFLQLNAPDIQWPDGLEVYEPVIREQLEKKDGGQEGTRIYEYAFTANRPDSFVLPPVRYSYFDPASGAYRLLEYELPALEVSGAVALQPKPLAMAKGGRSGWLFLLLFLPLVAGWVMLKRIKKTSAKEVAPPTEDPVRLTETFLLMLPFEKKYPLLVSTIRDFKSRHNLAAKETEKLDEIIRSCQEQFYSGNEEDNVFSEMTADAFRIFRRHGYSAYL